MTWRDQLGLTGEKLEEIVVFVTNKTVGDDR